MPSLTTRSNSLQPTGSISVPSERGSDYQVYLPVGRVLRGLELECRRIPVGQESLCLGLIGRLHHGTQSALPFHDISGAGCEKVLYMISSASRLE